MVKQKAQHRNVLSFLPLATLMGFEPTVSTVTGWHVRPLHHRAEVVGSIARGLAAVKHLLVAILTLGLEHHGANASIGLLVDHPVLHETARISTVLSTNILPS